MVFENNKVTNNAETTLFSTISASATSLIVNTGEGAIFPTTFPFKLTLEKFSGVNVIKREIVKVTNRVGDAFTIVRGNEACVQDDTANPKTLTSNGLQFDSGDKVSLYNTAGNETDIKTEVLRLETDKLNKSDYANSNTLYSASSTGNDDYVITIPNLTTYTDGAVFRFKADVANVGPATLNVNSLGAIPLKKLQGTVDLVDNDIHANGIVTAVYNSTGPVFQFTSNVGTLASLNINGLTEHTLLNNNDEGVIYDSIALFNKKFKYSTLKNDILSNVPVYGLTRATYSVSAAVSLAVIYSVSILLNTKALINFIAILSSPAATFNFGLQTSPDNINWTNLLQFSAGSPSTTTRVVVVPAGYYVRVYMQATNSSYYAGTSYMEIQN